MIESQITEVSRDVAVIARTPIQASDLKGSFLDTAKLFLKKFGEFRQPTPEAWEKLRQIYDIRNVFVHQAGFLLAHNQEKRAKRVRQFIQSCGMLSETNGFLTLKREFCVYALEVAQKFLDALKSELSALCTRVRELRGSSK